MTIDQLLGIKICCNYEGADLILHFLKNGERLMTDAEIAATKPVMERYQKLSKALLDSGGASLQAQIDARLWAFERDHDTRHLDEMHQLQTRQALVPRVEHSVMTARAKMLSLDGWPIAQTVLLRYRDKIDALLVSISDAEERMYKRISIIPFSHPETKLFKVVLTTRNRLAGEIVQAQHFVDSLDLHNWPVTFSNIFKAESDLAPTAAVDAASPGE